jgi:hypothetical protein
MKTRFAVMALVVFVLGCLVFLTAQGGAESPQDKLPGPWANARVGDSLQAQALFEDLLGDIMADVEQTVTAADELTVTVRTLRTAKGKPPKESSKKMSRYASKADYDNAIAQFGKKTRDRKFNLDGKEIDAEEYERKDTDPKDRSNYAITYTVISRTVPSWILRVWRKTYISGQPKRDKLLLDVKRFSRKGA